jgi:hypothetical protein
MRPKQHETTGSGDLFRARLEQIINMKHGLVQIAGKIDWAWIDSEIAPFYSDKGRPEIETRFVIGCATPTGSAGHAGVSLSSQLTFQLDHSMRAGQWRS